MVFGVFKWFSGLWHPKDPLRLSFCSQRRESMVNIPSLQAIDVDVGDESRAER